MSAKSDAAWTTCTVRDLIETHFSGPSPTCEERNIQDQQEWGLLKTTAVTWRGWDETAHKVPPAQYNDPLIEVKAGDVLVTKAGPRHRVGVIVNIPSTRPRLMVSGKMVGLRPNLSRTVPRVLAGLLATEFAQKYLDQRTTGMAESQVNFANSTLLSTPLDVPPLPEQRLIAEILDTVDEAIRKTEAIIAKLGQVKQGLLHDLLTRGIDENGQLRDPDRHPEQFKDSPLGRVPKAWEVRQLGSLVEVLDHIRVPINSAERSYRPGNIPYYGANGQQGWIDRPLFNEPLILLAEDGGNFEDFATRSIAYRIDGPSWVNNHAHVIRAIPGTHQDFVFWALVHKDIRRYIAGGTREKLTQGELRSIEITVPPLGEQRQAATILDQTQQRTLQEHVSGNKLRRLKQGLMDDLLTGRVRVTNLLQGSVT